MIKLAAKKRLGQRLQEKYREALLKDGTKANALITKPARGVAGLVGGLAGKAAALPVNMAGNSLASMLMGRKAFLGPMRGKRLQPVPGGPGAGMEGITAAEFRAIKSGKVPGKAYAGKIGMMPYYFKRKYRSGGLIGAARKHPILAGGAALLGLHMLTKPKSEDGGGMLAGAARLNPEVMARLQARETGNPFAREAW